MSYNATVLQQMTGEPLRKNLKLALGAFYQEEQYKNEISSIRRQQETLESIRKIWPIQNVMKHPAVWMLLAMAMLTIIQFFMFWQLEAGNDSDAVLLGLSSLWVLMIVPTIMGFFWIKMNSSAWFIWMMQFLLEPVLNKMKKWHIKGGTALLTVMTGILLIIILVRGGIGGFLFLVFLVGWLSTYGFFAWLDCKVIHPKAREKEARRRYARQTAELEEELDIAQKQLKSWQESRMMEFACAAVPKSFWDAEKLACLINQMDAGACFSLQKGIEIYETHEYRENQRRKLEEIYWQQAKQSEIMKQQLWVQEQIRRENRDHNRKMRDMERRRNETLRDIKEEQAEHNRQVEGFFNGRGFF